MDVRSEKPETPKLKIFLLEDNTEFGNTLKTYLEVKGYEILWHKNLRSAETTLKTESIDLSLIDSKLPDGTGIEFLKRHPELKAKPIFFLTAREEEESAVEALSEGASDYLRKPFGKKSC